MDEKRFVSEMTDLGLIIFRINRSMGLKKHPHDLLGVSEIQFTTLLLLKKLNSVNMTELANNLLMTRQQLTKTIDSLEEKELVRRMADPNSRRNVMIEISEKGSEYIENVFHSQPKVIRMLAELSEEDVERFLDAIAAIREVLAKLPVTPPKASSDED